MFCSCLNYSDWLASWNFSTFCRFSPVTCPYLISATRIATSRKTIKKIMCNPGTKREIANPINPKSLRRKLVIFLPSEYYVMVNMNHPINAVHVLPEIPLLQRLNNIGTIPAADIWEKARILLVTVWRKEHAENYITTKKTYIIAQVKNFEVEINLPEKHI